MEKTTSEMSHPQKIHSCKPLQATLKPKLAREYFLPNQKNHIYKYFALQKF